VVVGRVKQRRVGTALGYGAIQRLPARGEALVFVGARGRKEAVQLGDLLLQLQHASFVVKGGVLVCRDTSIGLERGCHLAE
jgi:hypothetical protein